MRRLGRRTAFKRSSDVHKIVCQENGGSLPPYAGRMSVSEDCLTDLIHFGPLTFAGEGDVGEGGSLNFADKFVLNSMDTWSSLMLGMPSGTGPIRGGLAVSQFHERQSSVFRTFCHA